MAGFQVSTEAQNRKRDRGKEKDRQRLTCQLSSWISLNSSEWPRVVGSDAGAVVREQSSLGLAACQ
jgi:hypothetical protein